MNNLLQHLQKGSWLYGLASEIPEVSRVLSNASEKCFELNSLHPARTNEREKILHELLGGMGDNSIILSPFRCDFGFNITLGNNVICNFNLAVLDEAEVNIGDRVMIGPNCTLTTITHALDPQQRHEGVMQARPITIENDVWLCAGVTVLPGVTIGSGSVIGAGSVVKESIPSMTLAAGIPCRPIRKITKSDKIDPLQIVRI